MKQKQSMGIYTCIWIIAIIILIVSLFQNLGYAKVINYSGIVRGATQKLIKQELQGEKDDEIIEYLDKIIHELQTGQGEYGLMKINNEKYQNQLETMEVSWELIKTEIQEVRNGGTENRLYELSQDYFSQADQMVATAQSVSDQSLVSSITLFFIYLLITGGVFAIWYHYKQRQIKKVMYIDKLTGLHNFLAFEMDVQKKLEYLNDNKYLMICFDIDDFKYLNTSYGYAFGDQLLKVVAQSLNEFVQPYGNCGRNGSDHFYALFSYGQNTIDDLKEKLKLDMKKQIDLDIIDDITLSFGVCLVNNETSVQDVLDNTLLAHKNAKSRGKGCTVWYDQNLLDKLYQENMIIKQMHHALIQHEFQLYLQPKFHIPSLEIVGAESLVRWHMPNHKILYPDEFIPLFEKNGFIYELDFDIFRQTCAFIHKYHLSDDFPISVNFSRVTIHHKDFYTRLHQIIHEYYVPVGCIEIEITESAFNDLSISIIDMLNRLREEGFIISMDDFGAGYSSLNLLNSMSVDVLKIDRQFLLEQESKKEQIIRLIVDLTKALNMKVICEGVETKEDVQLLEKVHCPLGQGYYISYPIMQDEFAQKFLKNKEKLLC